MRHVGRSSVPVEGCLHTRIKGPLARANSHQKQSSQNIVEEGQQVSKSCADVEESEGSITQNQEDLLEAVLPMYCYLVPH